MKDNIEAKISDSETEASRVNSESSPVEITGPTNYSGASEPKCSLHPLRTLTLALAAIFLADALVMFGMHYLPPLSPVYETFIDALGLSIIILPVFILLLYQPMIRAFLKSRRAEEELRGYEHIVSSSNNMLALLDKDFVYLAANERYLRAFGRTHSELVGLTVSEIFGDTIFETVIRPNAEKCLQGHEVRYQDWFDFPDCGKQYMEITYDPYRGPDNEVAGFVVNGRNITERKQAEKELQTQQQRLDYILRGTNVGTWEWNVQTGETTFNERWAEIIGYNLEEISPVSIDTWMKFAHPDDLKLSNELLEKHFKGELDYYEHEARMRHKNGDWVWVLDRGKVATWTEDGKPLLMSGTHTDVTGRKQAEQALEKSEARYRELFDSLLEGISTVDEKEIVQFCNPAFADIFEEDSVERMVGKCLLEYLPKNQRGIVRSETEKRKAGNRSHYESEIVTAKGNRKTVWAGRI